MVKILNKAYRILLPIEQRSSKLAVAFSLQFAIHLLIDYSPFVPSTLSIAESISISMYSVGVRLVLC